MWTCTSNSFISWYIVVGYSRFMITGVNRLIECFCAHSVSLIKYVLIESHLDKSHNYGFTGIYLWVLYKSIWIKFLLDWIYYMKNEYKQQAKLKKSLC